MTSDKITTALALKDPDELDQWFHATDFDNADEFVLCLNNPAIPERTIMSLLEGGKSNEVLANSPGGMATAGIDFMRVMNALFFHENFPAEKVWKTLTLSDPTLGHEMTLIFSRNTEFLRQYADKLIEDAANLEAFRRGVITLATNRWLPQDAIRKLYDAVAQFQTNDFFSVSDRSDLCGNRNAGDELLWEHLHLLSSRGDEKELQSFIEYHTNGSDAFYLKLLCDYPGKFDLAVARNKNVTSSVVENALSNQKEVREEIQHKREVRELIASERPPAPWGLGL